MGLGGVFCVTGMAATKTPTNHQTNQPTANSNEIYFSNRSAAHAALEHWEEAAADGRRCVALKPNWAKGWARLGAACMGLKLYGDAREAYERAMGLEPDDASLRKAAERVRVCVGVWGVCGCGGGGGLRLCGGGSHPWDGVYQI